MPAAGSWPYANELAEVPPQPLGVTVRAMAGGLAATDRGCAEVRNLLGAELPSAAPPALERFKNNLRNSRIW